MKKVTVRNEEGGYIIFEFILNDDNEVTVEHLDGRVDIVIPEKIAADTKAQTERLEKMFNE